MNINYIILLICVSFCIIMFFYFKWYIKRRTSAFGLLTEERTKVNRLIAELNASEEDINAVTDRNLILVEDKIKQLKEIMETADKRIALYGRELDKERKGTELYTNLGRGIRAALNTQIETPVRTPPAQETQKPVETQVTQQGELALSLPPEKPLTKKKIRTQVESMINEGLSQAEIAGRLGISIDEVELTVVLINRKKVNGK